MSSSSLKSLLDTAILWASLGLSVVPIKADGSKGPAINTWTELQKRILSEKEIKKHFKGDVGIGIIGGEVSGKLEILDFDVPDCGPSKDYCFFDEWLDQLNDEMHELVLSMPTVRTAGGGIHLYYRCDELQGNTKLASIATGQETPPRKTIIETRGEGGYVLAPGCPPECHPSGNKYTLISGSLEKIPTITAKQRHAMFVVARSFDEAESSAKTAEWDASKSTSTNRAGTRPGDDYNNKTSWEEILEPLGWTFAYRRRSDGAPCWRRPGKSARERGISATVRTIDGNELFHSFSSNCDPLPYDQSITKFTAYAYINHGGDFVAAARELGKQGYGEAPIRSVDIALSIESRRDESVPWGEDVQAVYTRAYDLDEEVGEPPDDLSFNDEEAPTEASILHEEVDPIEVEQFLDRERLEKEEIERKRENKIRLKELELSKGPAYIVWPDFGDPPEKRLTDDGRIKTSSERPRDTAWYIINDRFKHADGTRKLHFYRKTWFEWDGKRYAEQDMEYVQSQVSKYLSHFSEFAGLDKEGAPTYKPFKIRTARKTEMVTTIRDMSYLSAEYKDPCWLSQPEDDEEPLPDPHEIVCCSNGLLHIRTGKLLPTTPAFLSLNTTDIAYDPDAPAPEVWTKYLKSTLDDEAAMLLQEWFGYCLVQDTSLQKMMMMVGMPGSGKSTAIRVFHKLVGESAYCSMRFDTLESSNFSLEIAIGKSVMVFPDARKNSKIDSKGNVVGLLLSISGEDDLFIDIKHHKPISRRLNTRITIVSNDILNLHDSSGALNRRMLWVHFPGVIAEKDSELENKLMNELPGILNWAIEGWQRLHKRKSFTEPKSSRSFMETFQNQASPIRRFIEDTCVVAEDNFEKVSELYKVWSIWRNIMGYKYSGNQQNFSAILKGLGFMDYRASIDGKRVRCHKRVKLDSTKIKEFVESHSDSETVKRAEEEMAKKDTGQVIDLLEWAKEN